MGKIQHNLGDVKSFEAIPKDWYAAHILPGVVYKDSKASIAAGNPQKMFEITWEVDEGPHAGAKIAFDSVSLSPKAAGFLDEFLDAIKMERTCLDCGTTFTQGQKVTKDQSKVNKAGVACPNCQSQGMTEWDSGDPDGAALVGRRCMIGVTVEASNKAGDDRTFNRVEHYLPIK